MTIGLFQLYLAATKENVLFQRRLAERVPLGFRLFHRMIYFFIVDVRTFAFDVRGPP